MSARSRLRELVAFGIVGGLSAGIDAGVYFVLTLLGLHPVISTVISFSSAFAVNYNGNRRIVFRAVSRGSLWRYVALVAVNLGLSAGLVALGLALGWGPVVAKIVSLIVIAVFNFIAMRQWVFRAAREIPSDSVTPEERSDSPEQPHSP